jgi:HNH endonuclease
MPTFACPDCGLVFACKQNLQKHVAKGVCKKPELKCLKCNKEFTRRYRFNVHVAKCTYGDPSTVASASGESNAGGAVIVNADDINVEILDFDKTSIQAVLDFISTSADAQKRLRDAFECGCLHEELTRVTHFAGPLENRNVVSFDGKGVYMKVVSEHEPLLFDASTGVVLIIERNVRIADDPVIREVLGVTEGEVLGLALTTRQRKYETQQVRMVLENGGRYIMVRRPQPLASVAEPRRFWNTRTRNCVAAQQGWQCNICDVTLTSAYDIDHEVPLFKGGADEYCNLQALCVPCHRNKTSAERSVNRVLLPN